MVLDARPEVFNHNVETVPRLYPTVRRGARLERSLGLLSAAKILNPDVTAKSGLMLGLGEREDEVRGLLEALRGANVDIVTIGQYLRPTREHEPVHRYVTPQGFQAFAQAARGLGFPTVHSGVFVRSSFNAEEVFRAGGPS